MNRNLKEWHFGLDNDKLIKLVLDGKKSATTYPYYTKDDIPIIGEESFIMYDNNTIACKVKTKKYYIMKFNEMNENLAKLEGEGDLSLTYWYNVHLNYFKSFDKNFNDNSKIVFEIFEIVSRSKK